MAVGHGTKIYLGWEVLLRLPGSKWVTTHLPWFCVLRGTSLSVRKAGHAAGELISDEEVIKRMQEMVDHTFKTWGGTAKTRDRRKKLVTSIKARHLTRGETTSVKETPVLPKNGLSLRCLARFMALELVPLPAEHELPAAVMMADAFADRPNAWRAICGSENHPSFRRQMLQWLFERNLWLRRSAGCNRAVLMEGQLACTFMFVAPETPDVGFCQMLQAGLLKAPFLFGCSAVRRFLEAKAIEEAEIKVDGAFRLERMVVSPQLQGQGIGSSALKVALAEADLAKKPVMLTTNEERNVTFYQRLGFQVLRSATRSLAGETYEVWVMVRHPPE
ncbi:Puromycin N-acetyltransferase [Durusdinium trenchii]|uniref:Puromycin N-acetyltransferase n=1 Tax=Durusdinium trenchii TaxID=1381693 RepID=A0ABP0NW42_9DINO